MISPDPGPVVQEISVSVVLAIYNGERFLQQQLDTLVRQTKTSVRAYRFGRWFVRQNLGYSV